MADKELLDALREQSESMDRVAKAQWLLYMATQKLMESRTPSTLHVGSYNFNPTSSPSQVVAWRQVVPRNTSRKTITFSAVNETFFIATSDTAIDIMTLVQFQNTGWSGTIPAMMYTLTAGNDLKLDTTEAIYIASLKGAGSAEEQNAIISWAEEIYTDVTSIPLEIRDTNIARPGIIEKLTPGAMSLDGDIRATFTREGVR